MAIYQSVAETIGNTPLVKISNFEKAYGLEANVYAKLEYFNPAGSVKDRVAKAIIDDAVQNEGGTLTTTSRGSSASFVTNKLLGLTTIDRFNSDVPIYWQRFLTAERVNAGSMPD